MQIMIFVLLCLGIVLTAELEVSKISLPKFTSKDECHNSHSNCKCPDKSFKIYCIFVESLGVENPVCVSSTTIVIPSCIKLSTRFFDFIIENDKSSEQNSSSTTSEEESSEEKTSEQETSEEETSEEETSEEKQYSNTTVVSDKQSNGSSN